MHFLSDKLTKTFFYVLSVWRFCAKKWDEIVSCAIFSHFILRYFRVFPQIARLFELVHGYSLLEVQWLALVISALETDLLAENMLESINACEILERYNFECWTMQGILGDGCWFYFIVFMIQILVCSYVKFFRLYTPEDDLVFAALNEVSQPNILSPESDLKVSESTTSEPTWLIWTRYR